MKSGKKERVVISCVTFEVAKITEPVLYYEATRVHLIRFGDGIYKEFYDEVCRRIREELPKAEIIEHEAEVFDFKKMMNTVLLIIQRERNECGDMADIYVNTSAGTSEYSAASLIASMMAKNIVPFDVPSMEYQVPQEKVKEIYYENGKPVGLMKKCREPIALSTYTIASPDKKRVLALGILKERQDKKLPTSAVAMIPAMAEMGLIACVCEKGSVKPNQNTVMNYQRNFVNHWLDDGWVEKVSKRSMKITEDGMNVLDVFLESYRIDVSCCSADIQDIS